MRPYIYLSLFLKKNKNKYWREVTLIKLAEVSGSLGFINRCSSGNPLAPVIARLSYFGKTICAVDAGCKVKNMDNKPIKKFGAGVISASIWKNKLKDESIVFGVTIERRYQDKEGDWQSTNNLRLNDLPRVGLLAQKSYEYLVCNKHDEAKAVEE